MPSTQLRLGTRRSRLALAQSGTVARALEAAHPGLSVELIEIVTRGDREQGDLAPLGGKGLFTAELEAGLISGDLDLAVHSLKDLPVTTPPELVVAAFPERADARDVLICEEAETIEALPRGCLVLTGALRRRAQLLKHRADLEVEPLRGNVDTRIAKWRARPGSALVLAAAGLDRLDIDRSDLPVHPIATDSMLPAPGQGTLAIQVRAGSEAETLCAVLNHPPTARAAEAERAIVAAFGGDCTLPLAAWANDPAPGQTRLRAFLSTADGRHRAEGEGVGESAAVAASACIELLRQRGADDVLARIG